MQFTIGMEVYAKEARKPSLHIILLSVGSVAYSSYNSSSFFKYLWFRIPKFEIPKKDPILKEECHTNCKKYRNLLSTLIKKSKQAYYDRYFEKKLEKY